MKQKMECEEGRNESKREQADGKNIGVGKRKRNAISK
jgi:hypothetical protein